MICNGLFKKFYHLLRNFLVVNGNLHQRFGQGIDTKFLLCVDECPKYIHANFQDATIYSKKEMLPSTARKKGEAGGVAVLSRHCAPQSLGSILGPRAVFGLIVLALIGS